MRSDNIQIFRDTEELCRKDEGIRKSIEASVRNQKYISESETLKKQNPDRFEAAAGITVSRRRTLEAASAYPGQKVCVLNFASASNPGGGVVNGSSAQEEAICRCSTLYFCLTDQKMMKRFYYPHRNHPKPLHNDDIIYTPGVMVLKTDTAYPEQLPKGKRYAVNVITCAAPNLRENPTNKFNGSDGARPASISEKDLMKLHEKRFRRILDVAFLEGNETIILGAFGCGAFRNSPEVVAKAAEHVIRDYLHAFRNIEFAVYCRKGENGNYGTFRRILGNRGPQGRKHEERKQCG